MHARNDFPRKKIFFCKKLVINEKIATFLFLYFSVSLEGDENCAVCLNVLKMASGPKSSKPTELKDCGHTFHFKCVVDWLRHNHTCPMCRRDFGKNKPTVYVYYRCTQKEKGTKVVNKN